MGLLVQIYRSADLGDCTAGGISSKARGLVVVNCPGVHEPSDQYPAALLTRPEHPILVPAEPAVRADGELAWVPTRRQNMVGPMHGGNLADSGDARWKRFLREYHGGPVLLTAVPIHDRFETPEQYRRLSSD